MRSEFDEYINMVDGVKEDKQTVAEYYKKVKGNFNLHGCNAQTNANNAKRQYSYLRHAPTNGQRDLLSKINAERAKLGIPVYEINSHDTRESINRFIKKMLSELDAMGVVIEVEKQTKCGTCQYFNRTLGSTGICKRTHGQVKASYGCKGVKYETD